MSREERDDKLLKMIADHEETLYGDRKKNIPGLVNNYESFDLGITQLLQEVKHIKDNMVTKDELKEVLVEMGEFSAWKKGIQDSFKKFFSVKTAKILTVGMVFMYGLYEVLKDGAVSIWDLLTKLLPFMK